MRANQVYNSFLPDEHIRVANTTTHMLPNDAMCCRSIHSGSCYSGAQTTSRMQTTIRPLRRFSILHCSVMRPLTPVSGVKQTVSTLTVQRCLLSMGIRQFCRSANEIPKITRREFSMEAKKKAKSTTRMRHISTIGEEFLLVRTYSCQNTTGIMISSLCL